MKIKQEGTTDEWETARLGQRLWSVISGLADQGEPARLGMCCEADTSGIRAFAAPRDGQEEAGQK